MLLNKGKYKVLSVIGQGGFGITYKAVRLSDGATVCVKEYFPEGLAYRNPTTGYVNAAADEKQFRGFELYKAKFLKEARVLHSLDHPNIVNVWEVFEENGTAYYVMEYIDGRTLSDLIPFEGLPERLAMDVLEPIVEAVIYIHQRQLCHFDIKPDNIIISDDARPVLIDFGVAKHYDATGKETTSTPAGISIGYAPVEQYMAGGIKTYTPETDVYALGATYYKLLTGQTPLPSTDLISMPLEFPDSVSDVAKDAISQAMKPYRKDRTKSAKKFLEMIQGKNSGISCHTPSPATGQQQADNGSAADFDFDRELEALESRVSFGERMAKFMKPQVLLIFTVFLVGILIAVIFMPHVTRVSACMDDQLMVYGDSIHGDSSTWNLDRLCKNGEHKQCFEPLNTIFERQGDTVFMKVQIQDNEPLQKKLKKEGLEKNVGYILAYNSLSDILSELKDIDGVLVVDYETGSSSPQKSMHHEYKGDDLLLIPTSLTHTQQVLRDYYKKTTVHTKSTDEFNIVESPFDGYYIHMHITFMSPDMDYLYKTVNLSEQEGFPQEVMDAIKDDDIKLAMTKEWRKDGIIYNRAIKIYDIN